VSLDWETIDRNARSGNIARVSALLVAATEDERLAFAPEVRAALSSDSWWRDGFGAFAIVVLGTMPSAPKAAALLTRRDMRDRWGRIPIKLALPVIRARNLPWLGDLATRLAAKLTSTSTWDGSWPFVSALLAESGTAPPVTDVVVRCWMNRAYGISYEERTAPLADHLRADPHLDVMLPALFELDGMGSTLTGTTVDPETGRWSSNLSFPPAVAQLVAEGRLSRGQILDATIDRLARGDRPAWLRPFVLLHDELSPTLDETAAHITDYARLLPDAPSTVATLAQKSLRKADEAGRLELTTLLEASHPTLTRKEKSLVKAQLTWLEKVARRTPSHTAEVLETVAAAFDHPALEIQERALTLVLRHADALSTEQRARLAEAATALGGALPTQAAKLLPTAVPAGHPAAPAGQSVALLPATPPMPAPVSGPIELAEEVAALMHDATAVRWERVLAGLVALRPTDDTSALRSLLDRNGSAFVEGSWPPRPHLIALGSAIRTIIGGFDLADQSGRRWRRLVEAVRTRPPHAAHPELGGAPDRMLTLRIIEIGLHQPKSPIPLLLATPTHTNGSLDAATLVARLQRAETEGWEPWPLDFEQALLRLPRNTDPAAAAALKSPRLFDWLTDGGLPDPINTRTTQHTGEMWHGPAMAGRVVAGLTPSRPPRLSIEDQLLTITRRPVLIPEQSFQVHSTSVLAAALPHHREVAAAWALPGLASLADMDQKGGADLLPLLAECNGPLGPASSLAMAYALSARHEPDRIAAADAFLTFTTTPGPPAATGTRDAASASIAGGSFAGRVGADLAELVLGGMVKLNRAVLSLTDVHQAGADRALWELLAVALPPMLGDGSARGLPDLLELATQVAAAAEARDELPGLVALAAGSGSSRLRQEARRLRAVLETVR
jgi:hypothetical protein